MTYSTGHPWHYVLGGKVLSIKEIWNEANASDYRGYRRDTIKKYFGKSDKLKALKSETIINLKRDINRYRECALALHRYRNKLPKNHQPTCEGVHVAISLKKNHIYNEFSNLKYINELLYQQPDLFD